MKKFTAIILLLLYSTANFGLSMRLDYCGERLSDISFYSGEKQLSECCLILDLDEDCCNSAQIFLQENSDKIQKTSNQGSSHAVIDGHELTWSNTFPSKQSLAKAWKIQPDSPPGKVRLHALHACFLI